MIEKFSTSIGDFIIKMSGMRPTLINSDKEVIAAQ